jgi:hypothetical protein
MLPPLALSLDFIDGWRDLCCAPCVRVPIWFDGFVKITAIVTPSSFVKRKCCIAGIHDAVGADLIFARCHFMSMKLKSIGVVMYRRVLSQFASSYAFETISHGAQVGLEVGEFVIHQQYKKGSVEEN